MSESGWVLAIVGSRGVTDEEEVRGIVAVLYAVLPTVARIVSGGQRGVDTCAKSIAEKFYAVAFDEYPATGATRADFTASAHARNQRIVDEADAVVAVPCKHSRGTLDTIKRALAKGIPIYVQRASECNCEQTRETV